MSRRQVDSGPAASLAGGEQTATRLAATATITRECDVYVALSSEFDVASQGTTEAAARKNLQEALELFFEHSSAEERERRNRAALE